MRIGKNWQPTRAFWREPLSVHTAERVGVVRDGLISPRCNRGRLPGSANHDRVAKNHPCRRPKHQAAHMWRSIRVELPRGRPSLHMVLRRGRIWRGGGAMAWEKRPARGHGAAQIPGHGQSAGTAEARVWVERPGSLALTLSKQGIVGRWAFWTGSPFCNRFPILDAGIVRSKTAG